MGERVGPHTPRHIPCHAPRPPPLPRARVHKYAHSHTHKHTKAHTYKRMLMVTHTLVHTHAHTRMLQHRNTHTHALQTHDPPHMGAHAAGTAHSTAHPLPSIPSTAPSAPTPYMYVCVPACACVASPSAATWAVRRPTTARVPQVHCPVRHLAVVCRAAVKVSCFHTSPSPPPPHCWRIHPPPEAHAPRWPA